MDLAARDVLIGRVAQLSALDRLVGGVAAGRGGIGLVQGEPGIGKSTLIDAAMARAAMQVGAFAQVLAVADPDAVPSGSGL